MSFHGQLYIKVFQQINNRYHFFLEISRPCFWQKRYSDHYLGESDTVVCIGSTFIQNRKVSGSNPTDTLGRALRPQPTLDSSFQIVT